MYGVCFDNRGVRFSVVYMYVVLFCAVSDVIDYAKLKLEVGIELTLPLNVCAVSRALSHKARTIYQYSPLEYRSSLI